MRLIEAVEEDVDVLVEFWFSLAAGMEDYSRFNELSYSDLDGVSGEGFRRHFEREDIVDYLIEESETTIGFLTLREGRHPSREYTHYLDLVNLFIGAEYRNEGYGSKAVAEVKAIARERGCDHLTVSCEWSNHDARRFYGENGFEEKQVEFVQGLE